MKRYPVAGLACLLLAGCQSAPVAEKDGKNAAQPEQIEQVWRPSTLSEQTIANAKAASMEYRKCLVRETTARNKEIGDPLAIANTILKSCEDLLPAIKTAYDAENVPAEISERDIRKNRSQGAQMVLRSVMAVQAQHAADEEEAKEAAKNQKKKKSK